MAVPPLLFELLCRTAREQGGGRACAAGYPDLLVTPAQLDAALGPGAAGRVAVRDDSGKVAAWHGAEKVLDRVFESRSVFLELGYDLDVIDIRPARGGEIIVDLNLPLPASLSGRYDLVLDTGTCEHCFNIGQAAVNLASLVNEGGCLIQTMPLNIFNHGFYNDNPTWYHDFYPSNGFRFLHFVGVSNVFHDPKVFDVPLVNRFRRVPEESIIVVIVRRETVHAITLPTQYKYRLNPDLVSDAGSAGG